MGAQIPPILEWPTVNILNEGTRSGLVLLFVYIVSHILPKEVPEKR